MDKSEQKSINSLVQKVIKGDQSALEELFRSVGGRMLSVALGILKDRQLAEDAVQESLIKIVRYAKSFKKSDNGYGWICTIVRNESLSILRRYKPPDANIDDFYSLSNFCEPHKSQQKLELELAIKQLEKDQQYLIWLRYMCDMTVRDIADHLSIPKSTVLNRLKKAEQALKKLLE